MKHSPIVVMILATASAALIAETGTSWTQESPREELRPEFKIIESDGPNSARSYAIRTDDREGLHGSWTRTFPIEGGAFYHFHALRETVSLQINRPSGY